MTKPQKGKRPSLVDGFSELQINLCPATPAKENILRPKVLSIRVGLHYRNLWLGLNADLSFSQPG